jgi:hypothetical protein
VVINGSGSNGTLSELHPGAPRRQPPSPGWIIPSLWPLTAAAISLLQIAWAR